MCICLLDETILYKCGSYMFVYTKYLVYACYALMKVGFISPNHRNTSGSAMH